MKYHDFVNMNTHRIAGLLELVSWIVVVFLLIVIIKLLIIVSLGNDRQIHNSHIK